MYDLNGVLTPVVIFFAVLIIGLLIGKIKIHSISLDISAILITAILVGFILSSYCPAIFDDEFSNSFAQYSKLGTTLFMTIVGISSGQNITKNTFEKCLYYIGLGALIVCIGFVSTKMIALIDINIEKSLMLGILCGAMTSTPGLATVCEMPNINSSLATVGYGASYLFGVIGVVLYVQLFANKTEKTQEQLQNINKDKKEDLLYISIIAVIGYLIGLLKVPFLNYSLGTTGGILIAGIIGGIVLRDKISNNLSAYRNFGLVMFFVGNGILSGQRLNGMIDFKWFVYGAIITLSAVIVGDMLAKLISKQKFTNRMCIIAGGMTSTPAIGVLVKNGNSQLDMSAYSFTYLGALLTITIGIKLFFY